MKPPSDEEMQEAVVALTNDPSAPRKFEELHNAINQMGQMLADVSNPDTTNTLMTRLTLDFSDGELDAINSDTEFTLALCGLLSLSLSGCIIAATNKRRG